MAACTALAQTPYDRINREAATADCGSPHRPDPLRRSEALERAAALLTAGSDLNASLKQAGYRSSRSSVVRMTSNVSATELITTLAGRQCALLNDPSFSDIGIHLENGGITVVVAQPFAPTVALSQEEAGERVLALVNRARSISRTCGDTPFPPAKPLAYNRLLALASLAHANDMAGQNYFSHDGKDGSNPAQRVQRAGYIYRATGENIAAGMTTAEAAVDGWIKSPPHCANLMSPAFGEMGVGFAINNSSDMGVYWAQAFGTRR
jgi:uncharacterized protein YkwD